MWGKPQPVLGNKATGKTYIDHAEEEKNADFQPVRETSRLSSPKYKEDHNNHHVRETTETQQILRRMVTAIAHGKNNSSILNIKMTVNYTTIPVCEESIQLKT